MFTTRQNYHHSKLPDLGAIIRIPNGLKDAGRKAIVESFNLCDNVRPWSIGIHLANVRFLDRDERKTFSGFYLIERD